MKLYYKSNSSASSHARETGSIGWLEDQLPCLRASKNTLVLRGGNATLFQTLLTHKTADFKQILCKTNKRKLKLKNRLHIIEHILNIFIVHEFSTKTITLFLKKVIVKYSLQAKLQELYSFVIFLSKLCELLIDTSMF